MKGHKFPALAHHHSAPHTFLHTHQAAEQKAQLDAINERRRAKKHAEFLAKVPQINAEYCEKHGLNGEFIYIPKGNTFEIKDGLKTPDGSSNYASNTNNVCNIDLNPIENLDDTTVTFTFELGRIDDITTFLDF